MVPGLGRAGPGVKQRKSWSQRWRLETAASLESFQMSSIWTLIYATFKDATYLFAKILTKQVAYYSKDLQGPFLTKAHLKRFFDVCINVKIEELYSSQYGHYNQHWSALVSRGSDGG